MLKAIIKSKHKHKEITVRDVFRTLSNICDRFFWAKIVNGVFAIYGKKLHYRCLAEP